MDWRALTAVVGAALAVASSLFWAGWNWRGVREQFKLLNVGLHTIHTHNEKQDESIKNLYGKWDQMIATMMTKEDCDRFREGGH